MRAARVCTVAAVVLLLVPTGCSDPTGDYCAALTDEQTTLERLSSASSPDQQALTDGLAAFERLRDAAPDDLRDEWTTYVNAWRGLTDALDETGLDSSAFQDGELADDVDPDDADVVRDAAATLRSQPVVDASLGIEQHAADVCDVDLGGAVG
jgi:hypothetical protein